MEARILGIAPAIAQKDEKTDEEIVVVSFEAAMNKKEFEALQKKTNLWGVDVEFKTPA